MNARIVLPGRAAGLDRNIAAILSLLLCLTLQTSRAEEPTLSLSPADRVQISIFGHADLSGEFEVDTTGRISLPLVGGIPAQGLTIAELEAEIVDALQPEYLLNPRVTVQLISLRPFYILGEVNAPGSYPYTGDMTVVRAVAVAGGFTRRARTKRIVIRRLVEDVETEIPAQDDTTVLPGDVIEIPERFF